MQMKDLPEMNKQPDAAPPIRVMIVDDHKSILWGLERLVESAEPRMTVVGTAETCQTMLAVAATAKPDIILLDLDLNGEDATGALPDLLRVTDARVLVLTGARDPATQQAAILKGARGIIGKDESAEVLLHAIDRVHAGEVWMNRTMMSRILESMSPSSKEQNADPETARIASLTPREREIIRSIVRSQGGKSLEIAEALHISEHTLRNHLTTIYEKLGVRNRIDLYVYATKHCLTAEE